MARPNLVRFQDVPISSFADWDRVGQIQGVLRALDFGNFRDAAILCDAMLRDDRINGVIGTRVSGLTGSPLEVKPANSKRKAARIAEELGGTDDAPGLWDEMFPASTIGDLLRYGSMLGIAVAEIIWKTSARRWVPFLKVWHPQFIYWDWAEFRYKIITRDGTIPLPRIDEDPRSDGKWFVWAPYGYQYGWLKGLIRSLAMLYLGRQWTWRDGLRYGEVHGQPLTKVYVPEGAQQTAKDDFYAGVANRGSDGAVMVPVNKDGRDKGYDVVLEEAKARTHEVFFGLLDRVDTNIAVDVLGQNLTTEVHGGSLAASKTHDNIRIDKKREDARIGPSIRTQVLTYWAYYNYGDPELAPRPEYQVEPPDDETKEATALKTLGEALTAFAMVGAPIDQRAILDHAGVPMTSDDETSMDDEDATAAADGVQVPGADAKGVTLTPSAIGAIVTVNEARAQIGLGPLAGENGQPSPDGSLTIAEYQSKHADDIASAAKAEDGQAPGDEPPAPAAPFGGPPKPGVPPGPQEKKDAAAALMRLSARSVTGKRRAKTYADQVADKAMRHAAHALSGDLAAIKREIDAAHDFDDLKARIVAQFAHMNPAKLAEIVRKANIMAHLGGRLSAIKEV